MYSYGNASTHVGGRDGVPLPKVAAAPTGFVGWTVCHCGLKHRPGVYHLCIDLEAPAPVTVAPPKPKKAAAPKPKAQVRRPASARPPRKPNDCADCGRPVSKAATRCITCAGNLRSLTPRTSTGPIVSRIQEVQRRYLAGESIQSLADDLGVGGSGVRAALRRAGVTLRSQGESQRGRRGRRGLTDEQAAEAARMYVDRGMTMDAIGEHFGIGQHGVRNTLQRLGVERRRRGGPGNRRAA